MTSHHTAAVLTAILLFPALARAAGADASPAGATMSPAAIEAMRLQRYREGQALARAGKWDSAAEKFLEVVELRSAPRALIALGLAEEHTGHLIDADTRYRVAREDAVAAGNKADARAAQDARNVLAPRIPRLVLALPANVDDIQINVDARLVASRRGEVLVDPGEHTVVIVAPKRVSYRVIVRMKEGERQEFSVALPLKLVRSAPEPEPAPSGPSGAVIGVWSVGGAALVAGMIPLVIGARVDRDDSQELMIGGATAGVAGLAMVGLGFVAWRLDASAKDLHAARVQLTVTPGHNAAWIGLRGTY